MPILSEEVDEEVGDNGTHVEAHRPDEGELGIDNPGVFRRQHDGTGVQVAVQHGLR